MVTGELNGAAVLVTRPAHQAQQLAALIEQRSGQVLRFPTIEISELPDSPALRAIVDGLDEYDMAIFVSTNAVAYGIDKIRRWRRVVPEHLACIAIGEHTAQRLRELDVPVTALPVSRASSESLLDHPLLTAVAGQRVVIFRGEGGREIVADGLRARGAEVVYAQCYRRGVPSVDTTALVGRLQAGRVDIATFTSVATVENLLQMLGSQYRSLLSGLPAVVLSERIAAVCRKYGIKPLIAPAVGDEAIVAAICAWRTGTS